MRGHTAHSTVSFSFSRAVIASGQTFNLFNNVYQSISGQLNRKENENTLETEIVEPTTAEPHM